MNTPTKSQPREESGYIPPDLLARLGKADSDATSAEHAANMLVRFSEEARMIMRLSLKTDPVSLVGLRKKFGDEYMIHACNSHEKLLAQNKGLREALADATCACQTVVNMMHEAADPKLERPFVWKDVALQMYAVMNNLPAYRAALAAAGE